MIAHLEPQRLERVVQLVAAAHDIVTLLRDLTMTLQPGSVVHGELAQRESRLADAYRLVVDVRVLPAEVLTLEDVLELSGDVRSGLTAGRVASEDAGATHFLATAPDTAKDLVRALPRLTVGAPAHLSDVDPGVRDAWLDQLQDMGDQEGGAALATLTSPGRVITAMTVSTTEHATRRILDQVRADYVADLMSASQLTMLNTRPMCPACCIELLRLLAAYPRLAATIRLWAESAELTDALAGPVIDTNPPGAIVVVTTSNVAGTPASAPVDTPAPAPVEADVVRVTALVAAPSVEPQEPAPTTAEPPPVMPTAPAWEAPVAPSHVAPAEPFLALVQQTPAAPDDDGAPPDEPTASVDGSITTVDEPTNSLEQSTDTGDGPAAPVAEPTTDRLLDLPSAPVITERSDADGEPEPITTTGQAMDPRISTAPSTGPELLREPRVGGEPIDFDDLDDFADDEIDLSELEASILDDDDEDLDQVLASLPTDPTPQATPTETPPTEPTSDIDEDYDNEDIDLTELEPSILDDDEDLDQIPALQSMDEVLAEPAVPTAHASAAPQPTASLPDQITPALTTPSHDAAATMASAPAPEPALPTPSFDAPTTMASVPAPAPAHSTGYGEQIPVQAGQTSVGEPYFPPPTATRPPPVAEAPQPSILSVPPPAPSLPTVAQYSGATEATPTNVPAGESPERRIARLIEGVHEIVKLLPTFPVALDRAQAEDQNLLLQRLGVRVEERYDAAVAAGVDIAALTDEQIDRLPATQDIKLTGTLADGTLADWERRLTRVFVRGARLSVAKERTPESTVTGRGLVEAIARIKVGELAGPDLPAELAARQDWQAILASLTPEHGAAFVTVTQPQAETLTVMTTTEAAALAQAYVAGARQPNQGRLPRYVTHPAAANPVVVTWARHPDADAEKKLFDYLVTNQDERLDELTHGQITVVSTEGLCPWCVLVALQFLTDYPGLTMTLRLWHASPRVAALVRGRR